LNLLPKIDYEAVTKFKFEIMRSTFAASKDLTSSNDFKKWVASNEYWLLPYSLYMTLRTKYNTPDWSLWKEHKNITREALRKAYEPSSEFYNEVLFYNYVQYNLHLQLKEAAE